MKSDVLLLLWNCAECTELKRNIPMEKSFDDNALGKNNQHFHVYYSFSNSGFEKIKGILNIEEGNAPILKTCDGKIITDINNMIEYFKDQY
jgi:hypothetical protein